jgi:hypothetical protein
VLSYAAMWRWGGGTKAALAIAATLTAALALGAACSVDGAGLGSNAATSTGGAGGARATGGHGATGGAIGAGGSGMAGAGALGGVTGTGGSGGSGGGGVGTGGVVGTGGGVGTGGAGGTSTPDCSGFPAGASFVTPTDGLLHCYWLHGGFSGWDSAEYTCASEGGTLATILSSEENMFVLQVLVQANLVGPNSVVWLGASDGKASDDRSGPGTYTWVTGEPWGFTNWHGGQPDGSCTCQSTNGCDCDHWLTIGEDGTWYDRNEASGRSSICEAVAD